MNSVDGNVCILIVRIVTRSWVPVYVCVVCLNVCIVCIQPYIQTINTRTHPTRRDINPARSDVSYKTRARCALCLSAFCCMSASFTITFFLCLFIQTHTKTRQYIHCKQTHVNGMHTCMLHELNTLALPFRIVILLESFFFLFFNAQQFPSCICPSSLQCPLGRRSVYYSGFVFFCSPSPLPLLVL